MTSPASSSGSGTLFEAQVGASYLLSMLLEVDARGLPNCRIESIQLQRGEEGHPLDDVIVEGQDRKGNAAILEIQVKRTITFTPSDKVFQDVVAQIKRAVDLPGFWDNNHQLAVAIARTTQKIESAYQDVLNWARNIEDASTFHDRLNRSNAANDSMRSLVSVFRANLKGAGAAHDDESVWKLLQRFQILVFEFTVTGSASVELMRERALRALDAGSVDEARNLWSRLTELCLEIATNAGHRTRETLLADLQTFRLAASRNNRRALEAIAEESRLALSDINDTVSGVRLMRQHRVDAVREAMSRSRYVEIRGEAGVGKSGILRHLAEDLSVEAHVLVLSPNRVVGRGWLSMKTAIGYDGTGRNLMNDLSLSGSAIVFIDNLDFFHPEEQTTVKDLVQFAAEVPNVWVIATARAEFAQAEPTWLPKDALTRLGNAECILIKDLDDAEVGELQGGAQRLALLLSDSHPARAIVRNLFRLSRLVKRPEDEPWPVTEAEMAKQWWDLADGKTDEGLRDRSRLLRRLTVHSLSSSEPYNAETESVKSLNDLVASGTLREYGNDRVTFRHDVLREWAIANFAFAERAFGSLFPLTERAAPDLGRGAELAARMALEQPDGLQRWQEFLASLASAHETWRRAVLLALVRSEISIRLLPTVGAVLLEHDGALLKDLTRYVIAVEFESGVERLQAKGLKLEGVPAIWKVPRNSSCAHLVVWLLSVSDTLPPAALPQAVKVYSSYVMGTLGSDVFTPLILPHLHRWLSEIETDRESNAYGFVNRVFGGAVEGHQLKVMEEELRTTFLFFCNRSPELAVRYLQSFSGRKHAGETRIEILKFRGALAQAAPAQLVDFTVDTLIGGGRRKREHREDLLPERPFEYIDTKFLPASPSQGPFLELLVHCPEEGLRLVRRIVSYVSRFYRGDKKDEHAAVVYFNEEGVAFEWLEFYQWSRDDGNAPSLVASALMALEAWAHRRVEAGDSVESVVADVTADPTMSSTVLLIAVDIVLSHWPKSSDVATPLVACPELLCVEIGRPARENIDFPDIFGLKALQKEPIGLATLQSLKGRASRRVSLYDLLKEFTFGPTDANGKVRALLSRAVQRLGPPEKNSHLGDPRMMALHALNVLDGQNWVEAKFTAADGQEQTFLQYKAPEAEAKQLEPIREEAAPRLEESALRFAILNALYTNQNATPGFLMKAVEWAERHVDIFDKRPEFDWNGEYLAVVEAVVTAATLLARDGSPEQLAKYGLWARTIFARVHEGESDAVFLMRAGLRFNPRAIGFVGQTFLLQRAPEGDDVKRLLEFASGSGYASAHGFGAVLSLLQQIDVHLVPAILRCAFMAAVTLDEPWNLPDEEKEKNNALYQKGIVDRIAEEIVWLKAPKSDPEWPAFPARKARSRDRWKRREEDHDAEAADHEVEKHRVDYQRAALWLKQSRSLFDPGNQAWTRALVTAYGEWTQEANGFGAEKEERFDSRPTDWNELYFELAAKCVFGMSEDVLNKNLQELFAGLPDESFCDCLSPFLLSADVAFFEKNTLSVAQLIQIRSFLLNQLYGTRVFGWNKDRDEASVAMHLAPALATLCFNDYTSFTGSKCYLPASFIPRADDCLPLLEEFVGQCRSPFLALMYLNFMEVAPRAEELLFVVGCTEKWLERFPQSNQFWVEWDVGRRISSVFIAIFQTSPEAFEPKNIRSRIDKILGQLVELGVAQAHEMEKLLYRGEGWRAGNVS